MKLVFMGSPDFSVPVLDALLEAGHEVLCVYCQPPRPAGRGKKDRPTPVHARAEALGLPVRHPKSLKGAEAQAELAALGAEIAVVVAYGLILPQAVLDAPMHGCLNIHASLLPRWRGAAPIHRAIMAGDAETGVCIMRMEAGLDTGPVLLREALTIGDEETTGELHDRLSALGSRLIVEALDRLPSLTPEQQPEDGVTYAAKIDKSEARLDFLVSAPQTERQIRAFNPVPGAFFELEGERYKILAADVVHPADTVAGAAPGVTLDDALTIACNPGAIRATRVQRAGKPAMDAAELLRGRPITAGTRLA